MRTQLSQYESGIAFYENTRRERIFYRGLSS